jgi:hypothetical protein
MTSESQQPSRSDELFAAVQALSRDERKRFDLLVRQNDLAGKAMRRLRRWANGTRGEKRPPYIDCNRDAFRAWIEGQFKPGMSWENRREWHLDHIVPRSSFDLSSGVLVEVDGVSGILTAEHVVSSKEFRQAKGLWTIPHIYSAETVKEKTAHFSGTNVRMDLLRCFPETPRDENKAWGPDLAFIRIPKDTNFESELRAVRINFYSFARDTQIRVARAWMTATAC